MNVPPSSVSSDARRPSLPLRPQLQLHLATGDEQGGEQTRGDGGQSELQAPMNEQTSHALFFAICDRNGAYHSPLCYLLPCVSVARAAATPIGPLQLPRTTRTRRAATMMPLRSERG